MKLKRSRLPYIQQLVRVGKGLCLLTLMFFSIPTVLVKAQITPDESLSTSVEQQGENEININGGEREGNNLFHSFEEFSVPEGIEAEFKNALDIENIFTRVTGDAVSAIEGILKTQGGGNFFLVNPNGIIFGENAQLDVGGSFIATTADGVQFEDGAEFTAKNSEEDPILTVSVPIGLEFGNDPRAITVKGTGNNITIDPETFEFIKNDRPVGLQAQPGKTLGLVGGNINLEGGNLTAEEGRIELGSVGSGEIVKLVSNNSQWRLTYQGVEKFQDIRLSQASSADVSGNTGGSIQVQGQKVIFVDNSAILTETLGNNSGGNLIVKASESIDLLNTSNIYNITQAGGQGGDVIIKTENLRLLNGSQITNETRGTGDSGNISITAENVEVKGFTIIESTTLASGIASVVQLEAIGNGGDVTIEADSLRVSNVGQIQSTTIGNGDAGNLNITTLDIEISGGSESFGTSGLFAAAIIGNGNSGSINIIADSLTLNDKATISVGNFQSLNQRFPSTGSPGNINIRAETIRLDEGSITADTLIGNRGNITLDANSLQLTNGSEITTNAENTDGGNLKIDTNSLTILDRSVVSANASVGQGGNIQINSEGVFESTDSVIEASSKLGIDGTVQISTPDINLQRELEQSKLMFLTTEQALANSCLARSSQQGNFTINENGGLPKNSNSNYSDAGFSLTGVNRLTTTIKQPSEIPENSRQRNRLALPAQKMIETESGRIFLVAAPQRAESVYCQTKAEGRKD